MLSECRTHLYERVEVWSICLLLLTFSTLPLGVNAQITSPSPYVAANKPEVVYVNHGETFTVTFTAWNLGGTPNDRGWSHATISVSGGLEIVSWTRWSDRDKKFNIGDPIWHADGRQIPAQNEMLETYASFPSGTTRDLTVTFRAKSPGNQSINFRFTLINFTRDEDWSTARFYRDPSSSSIVDQQGWPSKRIVLYVQVPLPDLTVPYPTVSFSPSTVTQGGSITVSWVEKNQGNGSAGAYRVGVYLGVSEYGRDYLLGSINRGGLAAGASASYTQAFTIPSNVPPGNYYVTVFIDDTNIVSESNENNNIGSSTPNRTTVQQPTQLSVDVWTNKGGQGRGNLNGGQYTIGESITFYCSVNINVDSLRIRVIRPDGVVITALDRGPSSAGTHTASSQIGEPAGERRVICEASSGGQSSSDEVRFTAVTPSDTTPPTVRVITPNGGEFLFPGMVFRIRWEASDNVGVEKVHIWLFQGNTQVMVIASNLPNTGYYNWTVPDRPGGNYRIRIAAVDAAGNAGYDDSDGAFSIGSEITVTAQIVSLTTDKSQYGVGETVRVLYNIRNTGEVRLDLRMVVEIVDPSGQTVYDSHRTNEDKNHTLDPGQSASGEFTWRIPADAAPGTYEVKASLREWNIWDKIFDYRWGDRPGPRFTVVQIGDRQAEVIASNFRLSVGEEGFSRIKLSRAPTGLAGYEIIVRLIGEVADIVNVRFPDWAGLTNKSISNYQARLKAIDIQDRVRAGSEEIVLAEVVFRGKAEGRARIEIEVVRIDDDSGASIPVIITNGVLEVVAAGPPPVEPHLPSPRDLDGDGLYEDINGNGRLDFDDLVKFFKHFDEPVITQYFRYYDFNRNGRLDYDDIVELFRRVGR